ncbi:class 3 adenylate cyclase [Ensifer mexicanus]|nr:class 3 adenylate cyclase [Sinorhizobium mexicanum]
MALFAAVTVPLVASGISDAWFSYRDQRAMLSTLLRVEAAAAAGKIQGFLDGVEAQLRWTVQRGWDVGEESQHRSDVLRAMRQAPAIISLSLVDAAGTERLHVSRIELNRTAGTDRSGDPAVVGARSDGIWYGPVTYRQGSEPFMTMAIAGQRQAFGAAVADINLKLIWTVIAEIRVGEKGRAFVLDGAGRLIAHPDISKVLQGGDENDAAAKLRRMQDEITAAGGRAIAARNADDDAVVTAMAEIPRPGWTVFVEQPQAEALAPLLASLWRSAGLLFAATIIAAALAYWLARRLTEPIRRLEEGTEKIGAGEFDHRIEIATGDELERLAVGFNQMAEELAVSKERSERIARLKRFLAPQVAEIVEKAGDESVLAGQRAEVVVIFCDLRGFTAFSAHTEPEEIMEVLQAYYEALGAIITRYAATLTNVSADGLMVLVNAPIACVDPAFRAVEMAREMQDAVQRLISDWRKRGHTIGFGIGIAMGSATVGKVGYEGRLDYTAIGHVVNLASRLCSSAADRQILIDSSLAHSVGGRIPMTALGSIQLKGFDEEVPVYDLGMAGASADAADGASKTEAKR